MDKLKILLAALIVNRHNLQLLHWNVSDGSFDTAHGITNDYKEQLNGYVDDIGEMLISLGGDPISLTGAMDIITKDPTYNFLVIDPNTPVSTSYCFEAIDHIFTTLLTLYSDTRNDLPDDVASKLDEHAYWIRIESQYKNKKRMSK